MAIKKGDFITLDFTGTLTEEQTIFDTTKEEIAKQHNITTRNMSYEPITVCVGEGHLLAGLDKALEGRKEEETFSITLAPEEAFGKKNAKNIKLMPKKVFEKQKIRVEPGLQVTIDDMPGTIKSVSGNRVIVDFNHQLAGHELTYEIEIHKKITNTQEQVEKLAQILLQAPAKASVKEQEATISFPVELPEQLQETLTKKIVELTKVTSVTYEVQKQNA
ncbi:MAG: FKBP-type peptidyl-prolyl cis-trans isomerase [Candidatus Woesearchaeota archaeon]